MAQYFGLQLDTSGPLNEVLSGLNAYYNGAAVVSISANDAAYMKVWTNKNAIGTTSDSEIPTNWEQYATSKSVTFTNEGTNYVHAMFMDDVGNIGVVVNSASTIYDITGPTISSLENQPRTNQKTVTVKVNASDVKSDIDAVSGIEKVVITAGSDAHVTTQTFNWNDTDRAAGYKNCAIILVISDEEEEAKIPITCSFTAAATDRAGNTGASKGGSVIYDNFPATATMTLMDADCTAALPQFVNFYEYGVQITSSDTDIASYKIWEGNTEPSNWDMWTGSPVKIKDLEFSDGEGLKTIHGKVQDTTGNVTILTPVTTTVDTTAPSVTLASNETVISAKTGFNTVVFTYGATDTHQMTDYELLVGNIVLKSGTFVDGKEETVTEAEIVAKSAGQGIKPMKLRVKDIAQNWGESSVLNITVDLTAPTGSITANTYYKNGETPYVTLSATDTGGAGMAKMKVWVDSQVAEYRDYVAGNIQFTGLSEGNHTGHVLYKDAVDNESSEYTCTFMVDTVAPIILTVDLDNVRDGYTGVTDHIATIMASDSTSGLDKMKVWGDIVGASIEPSNWENYSSDKSISLTDSQGTKYVYVKVMDKAGNESLTYNYSVIYDKTEPTATVTLFKADGITAQSARTNVREFVAHISADDEYETGGLEFKLTGDFSPAVSDWTPYVEKSTTEQYMVIDDLICTTGDGTKLVTVHFRDKAGNEKSSQASFILDQTAPVITVKNVDYSKISLSTEPRRNDDASIIADTSCDKMTFKFSPNEKLQEFKVCVNEKGQTAEDAESIPTTGGSQNMSGGAVEENVDVLCVIRGADFKVAVGGEDGVYEVIVYGKDVAGSWSAIHSI